VIVLLTDFGASEYVGVMKGVILGLAPGAEIIDLCHSIGAQCVIEGAWVLKNSYKHFPKGAIFCCVVDPGVGTERRAIAVKTEGYYFVGPDNGLLWEAVADGTPRGVSHCGQKVAEIRELSVPANASRTFHGRDVFAKAAAQIEQGKFEKLGEVIKDMRILEFYKSGREGTVVRVDVFGNVVTNLEKLEKDRYAATAGGKRYKMRYYATYAEAPEDEMFLIEGSSGTLEISLKNDSANERIGTKAGERIKIEGAD
jgi:hypothetical protein